MKLQQVIVDGVGRFGTLTRMEGLGPGVNILSAQNEAGKSTLFRAIRACLFERHNTKNEDVRALATEGLSLPVNVTLTFEHDGKDYELSKSFLKSPSASLKCGGVEIARNRDADEKIWELLGIAPSAGRSIDEAAYGVLWVRQGQSHNVPQPSEAAASALNDVIQQEVGTLVGGDRARRLLSEVNDELSSLVTDRNKPRKNGPLDLAATHVEALTAELTDTEKRLADLDQSLDTLSKHRGDFMRIADPGETQRLRQELSEAESHLKSGEEITTALQRFESDERQSFMLLTAQDDRLKELRLLRDRIDENRSRINSLSISLLPLDEDESAARLALNGAVTRKASLDEEFESFDMQERLLQRLDLIAQRASSRDALMARLMSIQSFENRHARNDVALKANSVDDAAFKALEAIERDIEKISIRTESAAARLTIERKPDAEVTVNGVMVAENAARAVTEPLTIMVGDRVAITVSPPPNTLAAAEAEHREQSIRMKALLTRHSAVSAAEFRRIRAERIALEEEARNLRAELSAMALKIVPAVEIARLAAEIAQIDIETQRALTETGAASLPAAGEIELKRAALHEARGALRAARTQCEGVISGQNEILGRIAKARGTVSGQMKEIEAQIAGDIVNLPDERRQQLIEDCERERAARASDHRSKAALLAEKREQAPDADEIERRRNRADRLRRAIVNRNSEIDTLRQAIARLEGQVETAGGDGLGEKAADLRAQLEMALAELARQTQRVEVLSLLRDTVEQSYQKRREQLHAPLRRHLKPFLHDVFPQAEIELGDGFSVSGLRRSGPAGELFGKLSLGTQEQIAVLVRLAMGAMICERGQEVPIILDDALVFSDDARIEQMFDAINRAGRNQQVIVFTCRARSFASLGGQQLKIS